MKRASPRLAGLRSAGLRSAPPRPLVRAAVAALVATAAVWGGACSEAGPGVRVLRLGHGLSPDHPVHLAMEDMAARLAAKSGGRMALEVYPSGQLGSERECLELLQIGSLAVTKVSANTLENFAPALGAFTLPYVFRDEAHRFAVLDGPIGQGLLDDMDRYRLRGLTYYDSGTRSFYTTERPVRTPADLAGLKVRVMESRTSMEMVRQMGGSPTPISYGELYTALQQGVVDAAENNLPSYHLSRHYEVAPYLVLDEHTAVPDVVVIGTPAWDALTAQEQAWLQEAAAESVPVQRRLWRASTDEALAAVEAAGVEVVRLGPAEKGAFAERVAGMLETLPPDLAALVREVQAVGAEPSGAGQSGAGRPSGAGSPDDAR